MSDKSDVLRAEIKRRFGAAKFDDLVEFCEQTIKEHPDDIDIVCTALIGLRDADIGLSRFDRALAHAQEALNLARAHGNRRMECDALTNLSGLSRLVAGENLDPFAFAQDALNIAEEINYLRGKAAALNELGQAYKHLSQSKKALSCLSDSLAITLKIDDKDLACGVLNSLGLLFAFDLHKPFQAVEHYEKALRLARLSGNRVDESVILGNLSLVHILFTGFRNYEKGIDYAHQALVIARECHYLYGELGALDNLGSAYAKAYKHQEAIDYFLEILSLAEANNLPSYKVAVLWELGEQYDQIGDQKLAVDYYQAFADVAQKNKQPQVEANGYIRLGNIYYKSRAYNKAFGHYRRAFTIYREFNLKSSAQKLRLELLVAGINHFPSLAFFWLKRLPFANRKRWDGN